MSSTPNQLKPNPSKVTTLTLRQMKVRGEKIAMLTAYDYPTARALDKAGVDAILVGDSLGMVVLGYPNTLPVTMGDMLHHCRAVARGAQSALLIGDMPFMSYQASVDEAVRNAGRFLQEAGMDAVKLEGGSERVSAIHAIVSAGIPVMGHLGLTPQSIHQLGGFRPQARESASARLLLENALLLQEAGCFALVLESIPTRLAETVSQRLEIPTIGIGAGPACDGQVLVTHDVLGLSGPAAPPFAKRYAEFQLEMERSFSAYITEVRQGEFPAPQHGRDMPEEAWKQFVQSLDHPTQEQTGP